MRIDGSDKKSVTAYVARIMPGNSIAQQRTIEFYQATKLTPKDGSESLNDRIALTYDEQQAELLLVCHAKGGPKPADGVFKDRKVLVWRIGQYMSLYSIEDRTRA